MEIQVLTFKWFIILGLELGLINMGRLVNSVCVH